MNVIKKRKKQYKMAVIISTDEYNDCLVVAADEWIDYIKAEHKAVINMKRLKRKRRRRLGIW